nr:MAG: hypothetical protein [Totiviridae sp.]WAK77739.1 MAG: hypothetical protein [Totiviridae sp.]
MTMILCFFCVSTAVAAYGAMSHPDACATCFVATLPCSPTTGKMCSLSRTSPHVSASAILSEVPDPTPLRATRFPLSLMTQRTTPWPRPCSHPGTRQTWGSETCVWRTC